MLERLGRGGMGTVFTAYDDKLDRKVAIKVLRPERAGDGSAQQRLWREAQALARLSHPNVVTVHEVGRSDGAVFVVMEFLHGQSLAAWQRTGPGWTAVIEAYLQAGRGLDAAHRAGLVHRDFKPHNVMRTDEHRVKVLDFGLARETGGPSRDLDSGYSPTSFSSSLTVSGAVLGTPAYMAPEQHHLGEVDARSDQYAFCVALWEGLCSERPFPSGSIDDLLDAKEQGPPPWPESAPPVPPVIVEALRRGLSHDPDARWPAMEDLLDVLRRDRSRSRWRWVLGLAGATVVVASGMALRGLADERAQRCTGARAKLAGIWDDVRRDEVETAISSVDRPYAAGVWSRTEARLDEYADQWVALHDDACAATTIRGERSERMLDLTMACLHRAAIGLEATVDTLANADVRVVDEAHELLAGLRSPSRCGDIQTLQAAVEPPRLADAGAVDQARRQLARSNIERRAGRLPEAKDAMERAKEALDGVEYGPVHAERALEEGQLLEDLGDYDGAEATLIEALELASYWKRWDVLASSSSQLVFVVGSRQQRISEALRYLPLAQGLSRGDPLATANVQSFLGTLLDTQGRLEEAEAELRAALEVQVRALGTDDLHVTTMRNNLANVLIAKGEHEDAEALVRTNLAVQEAELPPDHPSVAMTRVALASALLARGRLEQAEVELRAAMASWTRSLGADHPQVAALRINLGGVLWAQDKSHEAEEQFRAARPPLERALGPEHPHVATLRNNLGAALRSAGKLEEAEVELRAALEIRMKALGPEHPDVVGVRARLASVLLDMGRSLEALPLAERAWTRSQKDDVPDEKRAEATFALARALGSVEGPQADYARARALAERARSSYQAADSGNDRALTAIDQWLEEHPEDDDSPGPRPPGPNDH